MSSTCDETLKIGFSAFWLNYKSNYGNQKNGTKLTLALVTASLYVFWGQTIKVTTTTTTTTTVTITITTITPPLHTVSTGVGLQSTSRMNAFLVGTCILSWKIPKIKMRVKALLFCDIEGRRCDGGGRCRHCDGRCISWRRTIGGNVRKRLGTRGRAVEQVVIWTDTTYTWRRLQRDAVRPWGTCLFILSAEQSLSFIKQK